MPAGGRARVLQEEGWVVCRAFKKRTAYPARSMAMAWDPSYAYREASATGAAAFVDPNAASYTQIRRQPNKSERFKQELAELDGAAALLQYSASHLLELPQLESPSAPLAPANPSQASAADEAAVDAADSGRRPGKKARADKAATDWRALDRFVASQLSPAAASTTAAASSVACSQVEHVEDDDMAALLFLNSDDGRDEAERWTGLLGPAAGGADGDFGLCVFEK
jgi:hypothetical protein